MRLSARIITSLVLTGAIVLVGHTSAYAAAPSPTPGTATGAGNALRISPVRTDLVVKPGDSVTTSVFIQNLTSASANLHALANDFVASDDETGNPNILLDNNQYAPSHSLKRFMDVGGDVTLQPQERREVKVKITIPKSAPAGGYFGAVRFAPEAPGSDKQLSLSASVASLFLVTVPGDVREQLGIETFNVLQKGGKASNFYTNTKDLQATMRFKNTGNVQSTPFGKIALKKSGKTLGSYEVNTVTPRGVVLPDSIRRFNVDISNKASGFGKYSLEGNFGYGSNGQLLTASTSFYVVPLPYLITLIVVLVALIIAIVVIPRMLKSHDRKLLRKVRGRK